MLTPPFQLHLPTSIEEAIELSASLRANGQGVDWIAGGTDLLPNYKWHLNPQPHVISLSRVVGLDTIDAHHIGAMARLHDIVESPHVHPLIATAASKVASGLIRRSATVGGNICLDTRCFWFNQGEDWRSSIDWCLKCDCGTGADCRVISNQNELCVATYQADLAPALMALGATIELAGPDGVRQMPLAEFFAQDGITRNVLTPGEIVTGVSLPDDAAEWSGDYQKLRLRRSWDFPEAGVAAAWRLDSKGDLLGLRVATTALESIPRLHSAEVENVTSSTWDGQNSIDILADSVRASVKPVNNTAFPPAYRKKMTRVLVRRALAPLAKGRND